MSDITTAVAERDTRDAVQAVGAITITTREQYGLMLSALKAVKGLLKRIAEHHGPMKAKAYATWKEICAKETELLRPLQEAEKLGKRRMDYWDDEQARIAQEEQARLRREQEERGRAARAEADLLAREAEKLAAKGKAEAAERARQDAAVKAREADAVAAAPAVVVEAPKEAGTARRETWGAYEIVDPDLIPREYLIPDHDKIKRYAVAMREGAKVPGIRFYAVKQRSVST